MAALEEVGVMLAQAIYPRAPYPKPEYDWGKWVPRGPARRLDGYEVAMLTMGGVFANGEARGPEEVADAR